MGVCVLRLQNMCLLRLQITLINYTTRFIDPVSDAGLQAERNIVVIKVVMSHYSFNSCQNLKCFVHWVMPFGFLCCFAYKLWVSFFAVFLTRAVGETK